MRLGNPGSSVAFLVLWSLLTLGADGFILHGVVRGLLATAWPEVPGTITHSDVATSRSSKSTTYKLAVRYSYSVGGTPYEGTRYRFSSWSSSNRGGAEALARRYAVGTQVPVFHAPDDAAESVLAPGLHGGDLFLLLFLLPFNLVMVGTTVATLRSRRPEALAMRAGQREGRLHLALNEVPPELAAAFGAGGAAFASLFVVGIPTSFEPSLPVALLTWGAVVAAGAYAFRWMRARVASGHYDLVVDARTQRLWLPAIAGRKARVEVAWKHVHAVTVEEDWRKTNKGARKVYQPTLALPGRSEVLFETSDRERAQVVASWLHAQLKRGGWEEAASLSA